MNRSVSDEQIRMLMYEITTCPECGGDTSPDDCVDRTADSTWICQDEDECGLEFSTRELVERTLQAAGMLMKVVDVQSDNRE